MDSGFARRGAPRNDRNNSCIALLDRVPASPRYAVVMGPPFAPPRNPRSRHRIPQSWIPGLHQAPHPGMTGGDYSRNARNDERPCRVIGRRFQLEPPSHVGVVWISGGGCTRRRAVRHGRAVPSLAVEIVAVSGRRDFGFQSHPSAVACHRRLRRPIERSRVKPVKRTAGCQF